jgi:uncharacterized protein (TIGR00255 family)
MSSRLRSMTGFARAARSLGDGQVVVTLKSVNHRGLDIHMHAPSEADPFEGAIRTRIKNQIHRGHVDVRIHLPGTEAGAGISRLNRKLMSEYLQAFRQAAREHGLAAEPDLNAAMRIPGMLEGPAEPQLPQDTEAVLLDALETALAGLNAFREREGAEIAAEMRKHNAQVSAAADEMEGIRAGATEAFQRRIAERLSDLLKGAPVDPQRLAQEAAILAERSDIGEELARLKIHSAQLAALLDAGGEAGKRIDFLLQEMNRETNTVLSKTSGAGNAGLRITDLALAAKAAIEKIREQSLNLE